LKKITIAIDGHSSCGKSTLAKALGDALGYTYISTGDMYRAVTLYFIEHQVNMKTPKEVAKALNDITLEFRHDGTQNHIFMNGKDVSEKIRTMPVANLVSPVSAIPEVRNEMVHQQQVMGKSGGVVMDGRDIGTVVFPNAELKIFLTADVDERARRRFTEMQLKGMQVELEEVKKNLQERDRIDSTRADSPLKAADDAILLDNTHLNHEQQLEIALEMVRHKLAED
jgi:CMP/dCMP kinase